MAVEPRPLTTHAIIDGLLECRNDGGTFSRDGKYIKRIKYAVGGVCQGIVLSDTVSEDEFRTKVDTWLKEVLPNRHCFVGIWNHAGSIYVDGTDIISNLDNALAVAKRRGELAIWDFREAKEILVNG